MVVAYCIIFVSAILLCALLTRSVRDTALSHNWSMARSASHHIHTVAIPRLGGVGIVLSMAIILGSVGFYIFFSRNTFNMSAWQIAGVTSGAAIIFLLGLYDDFFALNPYLKFGIQILAASLVFACDLRVKHLPLLFGTHPFGLVVSWAVTVFWILLITNAFNLVDGLDGLAAGSALFSTLTLFAACLWNGKQFTALVALALAGSILGFLRYNFNPATIFLGDCGSLFIGFTLSVLALLETEKAPTMIAVAIPIVSFGFPILDTLLSVLRRFIGGRPLFHADREHIHHKLMQRGLSHRQAVTILYGVSAIFGLCSALFLQPGGPAQGILLFVLGIGVWLGIQYLRYHEFFELGRLFQRTVEQKQIIINNLAVRRATDRLVKVHEFGELCEVLKQTFENTDFSAFEIRYAPPESRVSSSWSHLAEAAEFQYQWQSRSENFACVSLDWSLSLPLSDGNADEWGYFKLYRPYDQGSLQMDVNLLLNEFRISLNAALKSLAPVYYVNKRNRRISVNEIPTSDL